ncbi:hypothetical protein KTC96_02315 [Clostridium estertheticum]|uniref:hypothetical protein n=1 Tax=Clostridium estertheticum TaxID=238834 RepID=UPI001C7D62B6|nr:hypothetical protein [Clostridium estertheticum]MBX4262910.1 hypothetical protein [Clostridium estertheticum]WLC70892.1 hypothetical protein KTC96_02315 [Clostridium estertheticum]
MEERDELKGINIDEGAETGSIETKNEKFIRLGVYRVNKIGIMLQSEGRFDINIINSSSYLINISLHS